jgi:hypothetical protein
MQHNLWKSKKTYTRMTLEEFNGLLNSPEEANLEFKEAKRTFDFRKLLEYCVAIANEHGGNLILGVTNERPRRVVGSEAFPDLAELKFKILSGVGFRVDIDELHHPDGRVVIFRIPSRPPGYPYHADGKYLMRSGESLVYMTQDHLRNIFAEVPPAPSPQSGINAVILKSLKDSLNSLVASMEGSIDLSPEDRTKVDTFFTNISSGKDSGPEPIISFAAAFTSKEAKEALLRKTNVSFESRPHLTR